jgi:predicted enzyme related to lactoylglutathione lyase
MRSGAPGGVVHLELHTGNGLAARSFLTQLLGWEAQEVGPAETSYLAVGMGDRVSGGIVECGVGQPQWVPYVIVERVDRAIARADELGASVVLEPREGPAGWRSVVSSPSSGALALWQLKPESRRRLHYRP